MTSSLEEAQADLGPYLATFETCVREALAAYATEYGQVRRIHSKRTQASILHDHIVDRFRLAFGLQEDAPSNGVFVHTRGNLTQLIVHGGRYKARLKKHDKKLLTRNIPTTAALRFVWQQASFAQVPAPTNINIGYQVVDEISLSSSKVWVTCPNGNDVGWSIDLSAIQEARDREQKTAEVSALRTSGAKKRRVSLSKDGVEQVKKAARETKKAEGDSGGDGGP